MLPKELIYVQLGFALLLAGVEPIMAVAPSAPEAQQLLDVINRTLPGKIRIISVYDRFDPPPSKSELAKQLAGARAVAEKLFAKEPEAIRKQRVEEDVESFRASLLADVHRKTQEWKSGNLYRLDELDAESTAAADAGTNYNSTYINLFEKVTAAKSSIWINHDVQAVRKNSSSKSWYDELAVWNAMAAEDRVAAVFSAALGTQESIVQRATNNHARVLLDTGKLGNILAGQHGQFRNFAIQDGKSETLETRIFKIEVGKGSNSGTVTVVCDKRNQNRLIQTQIENKGEGLVLNSTRSAFDENDFPHHYQLIVDEGSGFMTNRFTVKEIEFNASFDDDMVFRFELPKDYGLEDATSGKVVSIRYPEGMKPSRVIDVGSASLDPTQSKLKLTLMRIAMLGFILIPIIALMSWYSKRAKLNGADSK